MRNSERHGRRQSARLSRAGGFSLVEALVAVLLFSIGILGTMSLQASMVKSQTDTTFRSEAANLSSDVIGVMWSDSANIAQYVGASCAEYARCSELQAKAAKTLPGGGVLVAQDGDTSIVTLSWTPANGSTSSYQTSTVILK